MGSNRRKTSRRSLAAALEALAGARARAAAGSRACRASSIARISSGFTSWIALPEPQRVALARAACRGPGRPRGTCPSGRSSGAAARSRPRGSAPSYFLSISRSTTAWPSSSSTWPIEPIFTPATRTVCPWPGVTACAVGQLGLQPDRLRPRSSGSAAAGWRGCSAPTPSADHGQADHGDEVARVLAQRAHHRRPTSFELTRNCLSRPCALDLAPHDSAPRGPGRARTASAPCGVFGRPRATTGSPGPGDRAQVGRLLRLARHVGAQRRAAPHGRRRAACRGSGSTPGRTAVAVESRRC